MSTFKAKILTPEGSVFEGTVTGVRMPGTLGSFEIKHNHAPIVSTLVEGRVKIQGKVIINENNRSKFIQEGEFTFLDIQSGAIELSDNKVILLTD